MMRVLALLTLKRRKSRNKAYRIVKVPEGANYVVVQDVTTGIEYAITNPDLQCKSDTTEVSQE